MATMRCPECGREYRLSATRCRTCDVALVETLAGDSGPVTTIGDDLVSDPPATTGGIDERDFDDDDDASGDPDTDARSGDDASGPDALDGDAEADDADDEDDGDDEREHVAYELNEWSAQARVMLEQLLTGADITRVWEGTDLVVRAGDEATVDDLVEQVRATDQPALDPDAEKIVYEVNDWTSDQLGTLTDGLVERAINYEFDIEGDLVVLASDEDGVEALLDVIEFGPGADEPTDEGDDPEADGDVELDEGAGDADDGLETAEILSDLFVACDRLQHNASDHQGVLGAVSAANRLDGRALPFGFEPAVWSDIQADAVRLRAEIEGDELTDIDLQLRAKAVRELLRDYV